MNQYLKHYINGQWTDSVGGRLHTVLNPATEQPVSEVMLGTAADVDLAVKAARERGRRERVRLRRLHVEEQRGLQHP